MRAPAWKPVAAAAVLLLGQTLVTAAPAVAAGPITIVADQPAAVPVGHNWSFDDYFPRSLKVPQGTTLQFVSEGFHTSTLLPHGISAASDEKVNGIAADDVDDIGRNINGTTHTEFNLTALAPTPGCGTWATPCNFDGSGVVSSGALVRAPHGPVRRDDECPERDLHVPLPDPSRDDRADQHRLAIGQGNERR